MLTSSNLSKHWLIQDQVSKFVINEFNKPYFENVFVRNIERLRYKSDIILFDKNNWSMNPLQFCQDQYERQYLYKVILLVNKIGSIFEFTQQNLSAGIVTPTFNSIKYLQRNI